MSNIRVMSGKVAAPQVLTHNEGRNANVFQYSMGIMIVLTIIAIFHVWSRCQVIDFSLKISDIRKQVKEVRQEQTRLQLEAASLKTPARIEALAKGDFGMALPTEQQVVMVK